MHSPLFVVNPMGLLDRLSTAQGGLLTATDRFSTAQNPKPTTTKKKIVLSNLQKRGYTYVGRYAAMLSTATLESAANLTRHICGELDLDSARSIVKEGYTTAKRGSSTVTAEAMNDTFFDVLATKGGPFYRPLCVSMVALEDDRISIVATGGRDRWKYLSPRIGGIEEARLRLTKSSKTWFNHNSVQKIPWGNQFKSLSLQLQSLIHELQPAADWLMLAVDPDLACLPWQHLINTYWDNPVVVTIVPSFSWAARRLNAEWTQGAPRVITRLATESELLNPSGCDIEDSAATMRSLRDYLLSTQSILRRRFDSIAVLLGHGELNGARTMTTIIAQGTVKIEEWIEKYAMRHRILLIHSCWGGHTSQQFLGDLGGLAGIALQQKACRLICAPLIEVEPSVVQACHEALIARDDHLPLGQRYFDAVKKSPAVSLYQLYGLPQEQCKGNMV